MCVYVRMCVCAYDCLIHAGFSSSVRLNAYSITCTVYVYASSYERVDSERKRERKRKMKNREPLCNVILYARCFEHAARQSLRDHEISNA